MSWANRLTIHNYESHGDMFYTSESTWYKQYDYILICEPLTYLLTLSLCTGVSRVRVLSPAWTGSPVRKTLISRTHLFLPHDLPPTKIFHTWKKSSTIKSWPTFCDQYFWKFRADEKRREIRFNDIRLLICLTPLQVNWVMVIN